MMMINVYCDQRNDCISNKKKSSLVANKTVECHQLCNALHAFFKLPSVSVFFLSKVRAHLASKRRKHGVCGS